MQRTKQSIFYRLPQNSLRSFFRNDDKDSPLPPLQMGIKGVGKFWIASLHLVSLAITKNIAFVLLTSLAMTRCRQFTITMTIRAKSLESKFSPNLPQSILGFFDKKSLRYALLRFAYKVLVQAHCPLLLCF